jgi:hypothetical protein
MKNLLLLSSIVLIFSLFFSSSILAQPTKWVTRISDSNVFWCSQIKIVNNEVLTLLNLYDINGVRGLRYNKISPNTGNILKWDNYNFDSLNNFNIASNNSLIISKTNNSLYSLVQEVVKQNISRNEYFCVSNNSYSEFKHFLILDTNNFDNLKQLYELEPNKIAIAYESYDNWFNPALYNWCRFGLYFVDTLGNVLFKDTFASRQHEFLINMSADSNKNLYMAGFDYDEYFYSQDSKRQMVIKKISPNGQLLVNKFLPYRPSSGYEAYVHVLYTAAQKPYILHLMPHVVDPRDNYFNFYNQRVMRLTWLDTNLNITKVDSFYTRKNFSMWGTKVLRNGDILCFGQADLDTNRFIPQFYNAYGWACRVSPSGTIKWERSYNVRDSIEHYITTADEDEDGSIYLGGCVFPNKTAGLKQEALIIKVDSNGCLGTTFCDPLGVHEIKYLPASKIVLFPNPAHQQITLQIPDAQYIGGQGIIYGIDGKVVYTIPKVQATQTIPISSLAAGNYWLHYKVGDWRGYVQFVVE